jgi:hypothetical protein
MASIVWLLSFCRVPFNSQKVRVQRREQLRKRNKHRSGHHIISPSCQLSTKDLTPLATLLMAAVGDVPDVTRKKYRWRAASFVLRASFSASKRGL